MAVTVERLIATLEARFDKYERSLDKALGKTNRQFTAIERRGKQMESRLSAIGANIGRNFLGSLAAGVSLRGAQQLIDAATRIDNALKVAGLSGEELDRVYDRLYASAKKSAAPLESLVELYGRAALVQKELGISSEELLNFTDKIAVALRVSGKSAAESSGALLQLSQALGSGVVRAEEFNSILEGALPIAQAAAAGLKEAGGSVSKLRQLVVEGKVSSEAFFRAFEAGAPILEQKVAGAALTTGQAFENLRTDLINAARKIDDVADVSGSTVRALEKLSGIVEGLSKVFEAAANGPVGTYIGKLQTIADLIAKIEPLSRALGIVLDERVLDDVARKLNPPTGPTVTVAGGKGGRLGVDPIQARIDQAFSTRTVSISDHPVKPTKPGGSGRGREDSLAREIRQIQERTAAIQAETAAQAGLNPLIDDYGYALERARAVQELLSAAKKEGIAVTPELRTQIDALAEGYAQATVEANRLAEEQDRVRQAAEDMRALGKDVLGGFIRDLTDGKSAADALSNALGKIADKLFDMALNNLFSGGLFGGKGGLLGGFLIPGILHSGGVAGQDGYGHGRKVSPGVFAGAHRYHSGGIAGLQPGEVPAILQRGEIVLPRGGRVSSASQQVVINAPINAPGADPAQLRRVEQSVRELGRNVPKIAVSAMKTTQTRKTRPA